MTSTRKLTRLMPVILIFAAVVAAPPAAMANYGTSGDSERGERPQRRSYSTDDLTRMSKPALRELARHPYYVIVEGVMRNYGVSELLSALIHRPQSTIRLIRRLENATSETARREIASELLNKYGRTYLKNRHRLESDYRHLRSENRLVNPISAFVVGQTSDDPLVDDFYRRQNENRSLMPLIRLLERIAPGHDRISAY